MDHLADVPGTADIDMEDTDKVAMVDVPDMEAMDTEEDMGDVPDTEAMGTEVDMGDSVLDSVTVITAFGDEGT